MKRSRDRSVVNKLRVRNVSLETPSTALNKNGGGVRHCRSGGDRLAPQRVFSAAERTLMRVDRPLGTESCYLAHPFIVQSHRASSLDAKAVVVNAMGAPPFLSALVPR
jgi:hypothetical protein